MSDSIQVVAMTCPTCKDTIFSRAHHDFRFCSCKAIHIDGGFAYTKTGWDPKKLLDKMPTVFGITVAATRKTLYDDWNQHRDLFGLIPVGGDLVKINLGDGRD